MTHQDTNIYADKRHMNKLSFCDVTEVTWSLWS